MGISNLSTCKGPTNDVIFCCSPVEVCDTLLSNEHNLALKAELLKLCMPLLSLHDVLLISLSAHASADQTTIDCIHERGMCSETVL